MEKHEIRIVAFLDILGFQEYISDYFSGKDETILEKIDIAYKNAVKETSGFFKDFKENQSLSMKFFSDCICISLPIFKDDKIINDNLPKFIFLITQFQYSLISSNIFIRGGISTGRHFENENIIFSEGLVKAYKLESTEAIYPRIIIDMNTVELIRKSYEASDSSFLKKTLEACILMEWTTATFINPFGMANISRNEKESKAIFTEFQLEQNKIPEDKKDAFFEYIQNTPYRKIILDDHTNRIWQFVETELKPKLSGKGVNIKHVLEKYNWLLELLMWTCDPNSSGLKFLTLEDIRYE